jgi:ADP-ribosylglycohydrolase
MENNDLTTDRIKGCVLGALIGDSMGSFVEFMKKPSGSLV